MKNLISIDIGSTFTKGVLFSLDERSDIKLDIIDRYQLPTTTNHLADGFFEVLNNLLKNAKNKDNVEVFYSSSAKGGLKIVAIGIVPELTLKSAKLAALSAGGKVVKSFSYRLNKANIEEIDEINPDIILFTGGTEGGNFEINIHNAKMLSLLNKRPIILYAGNSYCKDEIKDILKFKNFLVYFSENVLPDIDKINIEKSRDCIREIFIENITKGKGLDKIIDIVGSYPLPTPLSVFNFIKTISEVFERFETNFEYKNKYNNFSNNTIFEENWKSFIAIDMGGATTDFYSVNKEYIENNNFIIKGISEPTVKRTVEGDLGMRVSAKSTFETGFEFIKSIINDESAMDEFNQYVSKIDKKPEYLPKDIKEKEFDRLIALVCVKFSAIRHCGKLKRIFTVNGEKFVQNGKNLKNVEIVIGSGGYLSKMENLDIKNHLTFAYEKYFNKDHYYENEEEMPLLPQKIKYFIDSNYLLPILANISQKYPFEATIKFLENLKKVI